MSAARELSSPNPDASVTIKVDWLELMAFLSKSRSALLGDLQAQGELDEENETVDFGSYDGRREDEQSEVIAEIQRRTESLGDSYPYGMSDDGAELRWSRDQEIANWTYLFSLIMAHSPSSELLPAKIAPAASALRSARDIFQICSTFAATGKTQGPGFSIGWPRKDRTGFLRKIKYVWRHFGDGTPHATRPVRAPRRIKDGGIDVMSWWPEPDGQPGHGYILGQVASGANWKDKSVKPDIDAFLKLWFMHQPISQAHPATFIPFFPDDEAFYAESARHGYLIHRGRLPRLVAAGIQLAAAGLRPVERLNEAAKIKGWVVGYRQKVRRQWG